MSQLSNSNARINYAFVPATLPVCAAIVSPDTKLPLSHMQPIPGGINAVLKIKWQAKWPILCGDEGKVLPYKTQILTQNNGIQEQEFTIKLTEPLRVSNSGKHTLSGSALAGMIRNVLKVATGSYYGPINKKYKATGTNVRDRGEYPITSADINNENEKILEAIKTVRNRHATADKKREARRIIAQERPTTFDRMKSEESKWNTIAQVADRTYYREDDIVLDWTNAMMGFVLGEDREGKLQEDQWRSEWPQAIKDAFPQGIESRVSFGFAECLSESPDFWPPGENTVLKIPGASPKVTYHLSYLTDGAWNSSDSRLAGLKVYPVHDPILDAFKKENNGYSALFSNYKISDHRNDRNAPQKSDTLLRFLNASDKHPIEFEGTITCTNLAPEEFGALIWAIFLGEPDVEDYSADLRHNLGHLRGFGMGQLAVKLTDVNISINPTCETGREELDSKDAVDRIYKYLEVFEQSDVGGKTKSVRERLVAYKSKEIGNEMLKTGRLKPFSKSEGTDAKPFSDLKKNDFRLSEEDNF